MSPYVGLSFNLKKDFCEKMPGFQILKNVVFSFLCFFFFSF